MIPKNKRHLIVNKEYSRLPYWTDEGYDDVQRQVSQKYVQDSFGKFAESENQPPYLNDSEYDDGYQGLEYKYQDPQFPDIPDLNKDTAPKGTCYQLWLSLFGDATGAFIPTASEWNKLNEYAKKCPLIYMPHICCKNMTISGPSSLTPSQEANYTVNGGDAGCAYDMKASGGEFVGSKYFAPTTPGTYELYVTPWMSDDQGKKCASMSVTVQSACTGVIGYTTLQMAASGTQTLTVTGGAVGDVYTWTTTAGSFDTDTGTSVTFTAPATNAECASNPTISLSCGGVVVNTITIAVNANATTDYAYGIKSNYTCGAPYSNGDYWCINVSVYTNQYKCDGTLKPAGSWICTNIKSTGGACCRKPCTITCADADAAISYPFGVCDNLTFALPASGGMVDLRTAAMITAGCCPATLM